MKLSIIVPVYNTAPFLRECIGSILTQSFRDTEILLIDDGSTDENGSICDEYASIDKRIRVFHQKNGGVSSARNLGLDNAQGEWICFVDSDDELLPGGLDTLVNGISDEIDCVLGGYELYYNEQEASNPLEGFRAQIFTQEDSLLVLFPHGSFFSTYLGFICLWMFRNKTIRDNHLKFDPNIKIKEDTLFITQYLCISKGRTRFNPTPIYKYKIREDSATGMLNSRYKPDYLTSMDAVIQMNSYIRQLPNVSNALLQASKYEIVNRVYLILGHMKTVHAIDTSLISSLKQKAIQIVGLSYYLKYQYHRNLRRGKRIIKSLLRIN